MWVQRALGKFCISAVGRAPDRSCFNPLKMQNLPVRDTNSNIRMLTGGVWLKKRVQHPKINECRDRGTPYWFFRYWADELASDGTIKTSRKRRIVGPSKGDDAITRKQAGIERDDFLSKLNAAPSPC